MVQTQVTTPSPNSVGNALRGVPGPPERHGVRSLQRYRQIATLTVDELSQAARRRSDVDLTTISIILYAPTDPIQLVWMVKQAGKLMQAARPPVLILLRKMPIHLAERDEYSGCAFTLAYQLDSPTARGGGDPERLPKWRCPITTIPPDSPRIRNRSGGPGANK
jgi:hypothetical protein